MAVGTVKYTGTTSAYFTNNQDYSILAFASAGAGTSALYVFLADNGKPYSVDTSDANFSLVELYATGKVV